MIGVLYLAFAAAHFALMGLTYVVFDDYLHPAVVWSAMWGISLLVLAAVQEMYTIIVTSAALCMFLYGTVFLVLGSYLAQKVLNRYEWNVLTESQLNLKRLDIIITALVVIIIIGFPFFYDTVVQWAQSQGEEFQMSDPDAFAKIRNGFLASETENAQNLSFAYNLEPISIIVALMAMVHTSGHWWRGARAIVALATTLGYNFLTGGRSGAMFILVSAMYMKLITSKKIPIKFIAIMLAIMFFFFAAIDIVLQKGTTDRDKTLAENLPSIVRSFSDYYISGLLAFSDYFEHPERFEPNWHIDFIFRNALIKLGFDLPVVSQHQQFINISERGDTNVYTIYYCYYPDYGWIGTAILMTLDGVVLTWLFVNARKGSCFSLVLLSFLMRGVVFSVYTESFWRNLNFLGKTAVLAIIVYQFSKERNNGTEIEKI